MASRQGPTILLPKPPKGLGQRSELVVDAKDAKHNLKSLTVEVVQDGQVIHQSNLVISARPHRWWKFWSAGPVSATTWTVLVGREVIPALKEGHATVRITALNDSWGRFFRGGRSEVVLDLPVRFVPPQVEVLTTQHYINQGGCDMAVFKVSPGTTESGVQVGDNFFPSFPVKESDAANPPVRFCLSLQRRSFHGPAHCGSRRCRQPNAGQLQLQGVSQEIPFGHHRPGQDAGREIPGECRSRHHEPDPRTARPGKPDQEFSDDQRPAAAGGRAKAGGALPAHGANASCGRGRSCACPARRKPASPTTALTLYGGQPVDHQTHLGFDLAGSEHMPVRAANDGVVVFAGFFGIYGNAVVIDHGCGIQSLYGHMSSLEVKEGDQVKNEQEIGRSGQTGLAGGDHLHFTMLLDGIPVNPVEWWDPHWIHDRIDSEVAAVDKNGSPKFFVRHCLRKKTLQQNLLRVNLVMPMYSFLYTCRWARRGKGSLPK